MPVTLLHRIEETGFFTLIRESAYAYPVLLWLHLLAMAVWGAMLLLRLPSRPKWIAFSLAATTGVLLFGTKAGQYSYNPWFWVKLAILALLVGISVLRTKPQLAWALSLVLLIGAIGAARGPATVKDIMHSMVDPSAEFLFDSVQIISDEQGVREIAPRTDQEWEEVRSRVQVLLDTPELLSAPRRRAARPRDRSTAEVENQPAEMQALMDAEPAEFARRARKLHAAASVAMRAVNNKDKEALFDSLIGIDVACEVCHLRYWYPRDKSAERAAKEAGIFE